MVRKFIMENPGENRLMLGFAFFAIYFVWGTTYLANLFALESIGPFILSCLRYIIAGLLLAGWSVLKKLSWPDLSMIKVLAISGTIMLVGGSGLVVFAEQYISSGYAAVIIATEPLWFVILDKKRWKFYFSDTRVISGLLIGFAGVALFSYLSPVGNPAEENSHKLMGTIIVLISAVLWVSGTLYANKRIKSGSANFTNTSIQLLSAGLVSGLIAIGTGEWSTFSVNEVSAKAWGGLGFLVIMGSLVAYLAFNWLITVKSPAIVSTHTYVNPIVAIFIGWLLANERIAFNQIIALGIVLIGVILTQLSKENVAGRKSDLAEEAIY